MYPGHTIIAPVIIEKVSTLIHNIHISVYHNGNINLIQGQEDLPAGNSLLQVHYSIDTTAGFSVFIR